MTLERRLYLVSEKDIDVTLLFFTEMLFYVEHNIHIYIKVLCKVVPEKYEYFKTKKL